VHPSETAIKQFRPWAVLGLLGALLLSDSLAAQVVPNAKWRTITTEHFRVTFTPEVEGVARRAAVRAEQAYDSLSKYLRAPRGPIDIVVSDNVDFSNGYATPFPTNRIVLYANPPITEGALRFVDDPTELIVTHELAHVFHIDNTGGIWKILQKAFGRNPFFFPNAFQPSWLVEGLAVHYETKLTGSGRLAGSEHRMFARTASLAHTFPRLDQLSLSNPHFPYGYAAYAYGSLFMDYLAKTHGDAAMRTFVESSSRQLIPMYLNAPSRRAFGRKFTTEYAAWSQSLLAAASAGAPAIPGWRDLTVEGAYANFPRWTDDSTLVYAGTSGRESYGAYRLQQRSGGTSRDRIGRRHTESPNAVLPDGSLLYSQLEYASPYELRSDLYVDQARGGTRRLTRGARLSIPDARSDGLIVAMQTVPAGTRLALVSSDGRQITPITSGGPDEQWAEPRWSPDGRHIATIRWTIGGTSEVVVVDTAGTIRAILIRERAVVSTPSWSRTGRSVYFSSDRTGITNLYRVDFVPRGPERSEGSAVVQLTDVATGLFEPQPSPNDSTLAAVVFRADGYHIGVTSLDSLTPTAAPTIEAVTPRTSHPAPLSNSQSKPYSPWRSLLPRFWIPFGEPALEENSVRLGAYTLGEDLVGRHSYEVLLFVPSDNSGLTGSVYYRNARLGRPYIEAVASQDWENFRAILDASQQNRRIGTLRRRIRDATVGLTFERPRVRTRSYLSLAGGVETRSYLADSAPLLARVDSIYRRQFYYPRAVVSLGWNNFQYPALAISQEDGFSVAGTARYRWRMSDTVRGTVSLVGSSSIFKSINLPGFAHHVIGLHGAGGFLDNRGTGYLEVGGVSGGTLDVLPGYVLGEGRRTFSVRGFPAASLVGIRAFTASGEYRAPLTIPGRGLGTLPLFLDRTSITLFGDVGAAWCSGIYPTRPAPSTSLCTRGEYDFGRTTSIGAKPFIFLEPHAIASVGAELNVSAAILSWDAPFRYRLGIAAPVLGRTLVDGEQKISSYFAVGVSF
jgi:hypothetical protein